MTNSGLQFIEIQAEDKATLRRFYASLYVRAFPDIDERESLKNMLDYLHKKQDGWYGLNNYHIILTLLDGRPIGGAVSDYLARPKVGVIEFMFIADEQRAKGYGSRLREEVERVLQHDAVQAGTALDYVVAEMNDPHCTDPTQDNMDPVLRAVMWHRWRYRLLDFSYIQPALSPHQKPVRTLRLIARPFAGSLGAMPGNQLRSVLAEYMRWAMRLPCPEKCPEFLEMIVGMPPNVRLRDLAEYAMEK